MVYQLTVNSPVFGGAIDQIAAIIDSFRNKGPSISYYGDGNEVTMNYMTGSLGTALTFSRYLDPSFPGAHIMRGLKRKVCFPRLGPSGI
jgi:hypothetical protein